MKIFIFLLLFCRIFGTKINYSKIKADDQKLSCNFKDYNNQYPEAFPKITSPHTRGCGGEILSLQKIFSEVEETGSNLYGASNVVDLLYSRTGAFELNWNDQQQVNLILNENICKNHFKELYVEFESSRSGHAKVNRNGKTTCAYNDIFTPESRSCPNIARKKIRKYEAAEFALKKDAVIIQPGAAFCDAHWPQLLEKIGKGGTEESGISTNQQEDYEQMDHDMESDDNPESPDLNEDKTYEPDKSLDPETDKEKIDVVNKLGNLIGAKRIITQGSYNDLSNFAKRLKVTVGRTVLKFFVAIMGPEAEAEFGGKICSIYQPKKTVENKPKDDILQAFAEQYERVPDKITKRIMLGPVAAKCSYREVLEKIPGLSYFLYNKARQCFKAEEIPENLPKTFHRYDEQKIITFVEFFTSPHCMVLLPYGETSVKLSNGVKLDVAANMRMQSHKQIIRMFRIKMEEEGRMNEVLPLRTMYAILEHCHAKKSKELTCVDYFLAAALDGFDALKKVLDHWMKTEDLTVEQSKAFINELKIGQEYLQTDFSLHLQQHTEVISHCINHALGDPDNEAFTNECEQHLTVCPKCEALTKTLNDLKNHIDNMVQNCKMENCEELEDLEIKQIEIDYAVYNILELKSHIVRSTLSEMERAKDINLLDETKAYITLDWAQKLLPTKYRETQKDYFGKSGMSYHIAHVQTVKDGESVEFSYVHIIEKNKQDSTAVISIITDILKCLKKKGITSVILRSDNAGCYHSKEVILSLAEISEQSGVKITKYSFSEPQNGKGNSDRIAAVVKNKMRRYIREGKNVNDEIQFYDALVAFPGISYITIILASVNRVEVKIPSTALKGIASYYIFTPQNNGILVHRAANIGEGKLFKYSKSNLKLSNIPSLEKSKEKTFEKIDNEDIWRSGNTRKTSDSSNEQCQIFECPYDDETFTTYGAYMRHIAFSKHGKINLMRDFSAIIYQEAVKQQKPSYNNIDQALDSERDIENIINEATSPKLGWSHKISKKLPTITKNAEEYVRKLFNDGVRVKAKKWKPKDVATAMPLAKDAGGNRRFKPVEILFPEQIQQLFSKFAAQQKKAPKEPPKKKQKTDVEEPSDSENKDDSETYDEKLSQLESEEEDLEAHTDNNIHENLNTHTLTRARRWELEQQIDESYKSIFQAITD